MNSNWALPTSVTQYAEPGADNHVSWVDTNDFYSLNIKDTMNCAKN